MTRSLTVQQRAILEKLQHAYDAVAVYHGDDEKEISEDRDSFEKAVERFARKVRAADRAGLLRHPAVFRAVDKPLRIKTRKPRTIVRDRFVLTRLVPSKHLTEPEIEVVQAALQWLPVLEAQRKHRRLVIPDNGSPKRKLWSKHWKWLSTRVNCLHRKEHNQRLIRDQLVQELETKDPDFACQLKKISQQAWNRRFSQLLHAETRKSLLKRRLWR